MREYAIYTNENHESEKALVEHDNGKDILILKGDYHIEDMLDGFFICLKYYKIKYKLEELTINKNDKMYKFCDFY